MQMNDLVRASIIEKLTASYSKLDLARSDEYAAKRELASAIQRISLSIGAPGFEVPEIPAAPATPVEEEVPF